MTQEMKAAERYRYDHDSGKLVERARSNARITRDDVFQADPAGVSG